MSAPVKPELAAEIVRLWNEGRTTNQIAALLGVTRNTAVGHIARQRAKGVFVRTADPAVKLREKEPEAPATDDTAGCRYPMWGHDEKPTQKFCGAPRMPGRPYCEPHTKLTYVAPSAERKPVEWNFSGKPKSAA